MLNKFYTFLKSVYGRCLRPGLFVTSPRLCLHKNPALAAGSLQSNAAPRAIAKIYVYVITIFFRIFLKVTRNDAI
jgi:hypothetical protein